MIYKYIMVGCLSALVHYLVLTGLYAFLQFGIVVSTVAGFICSWIVAYYLNYYFTFKSDKHHLRSSAKYLIVTLIGLSINISVMYIGVEMLGIHYTITFLLMSALVFVNNYSLNKWWVF